MNCKSSLLESKNFIAADGFEDIHHTCKECGIHFNHLDGEQFKTCSICNYTQTK
jgi:ribosomal protein L37E